MAVPTQMTPSLATKHAVAGPSINAGANTRPQASSLRQKKPRLAPTASVPSNPTARAVTDCRALPGIVISWARCSVTSYTRPRVATQAVWPRAARQVGASLKGRFAGLRGFSPGRTAKTFPSVAKTNPG